MAYMNDPDGILTLRLGIMRSGMLGVGFPQATRRSALRRCSWMIFPKLNILFLNTGHLIMNRKTRSVEERIENAMAAFDYAGYRLLP